MANKLPLCLYAGRPAQLQAGDTLDGVPPAPVTSVFGRVDEVVAQTGDYTVAQVAGAAPIDNPTFTGYLRLTDTSVLMTNAGGYFQLLATYGMDLRGASGFNFSCTGPSVMWDLTNTTTGGKRLQIEVTTLGLRIHDITGGSTFSYVSSGSDLLFYVDSSGNVAFGNVTPASGECAFGQQLNVQTGYGTSSTQTRPRADLTDSWVVSTDATRKARRVFNVWDTVAREVMRLEATGTEGALSFFGAPAVPRPTVTGSRGGNAALASLLTGLASFGLITDSSTA